MDAVLISESKNLFVRNSNRRVRYGHREIDSNNEHKESGNAQQVTKEHQPEQSPEVCKSRPEAKLHCVESLQPALYNQGICK